MLKLGKTKRTVAMAAAALALAGGATVTAAGSASAAYASPPPSTTDWFALDLVNNPGGLRHYEVCDDQSTAQRVWIAVEDDSAGGARVMIQDTVTRNETYGEWVNFNPGGCEGWWIITSTPGDTLQGDLNPGNHLYVTGEVKYN